MMSVPFGNPLLDKFGEGARPGACPATGREHRPQPNRWQRPVLQHRYGLAGLQFRREQPFRAADGYPEASEHTLPHTLRGADTKTAAHINSDFRRPLAEGPGGATGALLLIYDA